MKKKFFQLHFTRHWRKTAKHGFQICISQICDYSKFLLLYCDSVFSYSIFSLISRQVVSLTIARENTCNDFFFPALMFCLNLYFCTQKEVCTELFDFSFIRAENLLYFYKENIFIRKHFLYYLQYQNHLPLITYNNYRY